MAENSNSQNSSLNVGSVAEKLGITQEKYKESLKKSLLSTGNNHNLKKVIEKMQAGMETVNIAVIGGSVTEGAGPQKFTDGYAYQFADLFTKKYAKDASKVKFDPAGLGGTPSALGLIRYKKDVADFFGKEPDLLVVEFAVNDYQECSSTRAFECLIRNALKDKVAVIVIYVPATYGNQQGILSPVASFYEVPQVSASDAFAFSGINAEKDSNIYYADYVHPTLEGHTFLAECLMNLVENLWLKEEDKEFKLPQGFKNEKPFVNYKTILRNTDNEGFKISEGSFSQTDDSTQIYLKGGKTFPVNWQHKKGENEPFTIKADCKAVMLETMNEAGNEIGSAEIYVDGVLKTTLNGAGSWNNCVTNLILDEEEKSEHIIEIKMVESDIDKVFTICAIGIVQ